MKLKKKILAKLTVLIFSLTLFSNMIPNVAYADTVSNTGSQHFNIALKINGQVISDGSTITLKNGEPVDFRLDFKCDPNIQAGDKLTFTLPSAFKGMKLLEYPTVCFDKPIINGNTVTLVANKNIQAGILGGYLYLQAVFNSTNSSGKITVPIDVNGNSKNVTINYNPPTNVSIDKTVNSEKTLGLNSDQIGETLHYKVVVNDENQTTQLPFIDEMQPGIDLNTNSIKIINSNGQDVTNQVKDAMQIVKGDSGTKIEIPNFPLNGKYTLTYDATVNKDMAQGKDVWARANTATMGKANSTATVIVNADGGKELTPDAMSNLTKKTVYGDTYNKVGDIKQYTLTVNSDHYEIPAGVTVTDKLPEGLNFTDNNTSGLNAGLNSPYDGGTTPPMTVYLISATGQKEVVYSQGANPGVEVTLNQQNRTISIKTLQEMNSRITVQYNAKVDKKLDSITNTAGTIIGGHEYKTSATIKYSAPETAYINKTANNVKNATIRVGSMQYPINYGITVDTTDMTTPKNLVDNMQTGLKLLPDTIKIVNTKTNEDITSSLKNSITTSTDNNGTTITIKNFPVGGTYNVTYQALPDAGNKPAWVRKNTATLGNATSEASVTLNSDLGSTVTPDQVKKLTTKTLLNGGTYSNIGSLLRYKVVMNDQHYQLPVGTKIVDKFPSELTFPDVKDMNITSHCSGPNGQFAPGQLNTYWIGKDGNKTLIQNYPNVIGTLTFDSRDNTITLELTKATNSSYEFEYSAKVAHIAATITNSLQTQVGETTAESSATASFKTDAGLIGAKKTVNRSSLVFGENQNVQYGINVTSWGAFPKGYLNIVDNINPLLKITSVQVPQGFSYEIDGNKVEIKNEQTVIGTLSNPLIYNIKINTSFENVKNGTTIDNTAYVNNIPTNKVTTAKGYEFNAVKKANEDHSKLLEGAVYGVYNEANNQLIYKVTSNKDGVLEGALAGPGKYYLQEITPPTGYTKSDEKTNFTVTASDIGKTIELPAIYDSLIPGNISITKENTNGDKLAGAKFDLMQNNKVIQQGVTDKNGELNFKDIPQGEYQIVEVEAPNGYELAKTQNITVETNKTTPIKIIDKKINGSLKIEKIDENGKPLANATFNITGPNGYDKSLTTDSTGIISLNNLEWGTYTIKETVAPVGYELDKTTHTVDINGDNAKTGVSLTVKDKMMLGQLQIVKTDATSNKALAGATFKVTGPNGFDKTVTTDKDGQVNLNNLAWGTYTVTETAAPNGYNLDKTPQQVTVSNTSVGKVQVAKFADSRVLGSIKITKTNEKGQTLKDAEFTITKPDGTKVKVTTNDKGVAELSGLAWGEYTVQETVAPQGYDLDNTVHKITIDNNNANVVQSLNVVDGAKTGTIQITKLGKDKAKLAGAQFTLTAPGKEPIVITTDSNGVAEAKNLSWGTYTIKETKAPDGYTLSDKVNTVNITA
ncbi:MAG: SpaA isopeptide-forming pilin-related protein, partial [Sarcina sp.]